MTSGQFFMVTFGLYILALISSLTRLRRSSFVFMGLALIIGLLGLGLRIYQAWPMLPMYLGLPALVSGLAVIWLSRGYGRNDERL